MKTKSNVYEAQAILENQLADALLIESSAAQGQKAKLLVIITPSDIEHFYSARKYANANAPNAARNTSALLLFPLRLRFRLAEGRVG